MTSPKLTELIETRRARIGVVGLGHVGLPLAIAFAEGGFQVLGLEVDAAKVKTLLAGESYVNYIDSEPIRRLVEAGRLDATLDSERAADLDVVIICVPTPVNEKNEPDLSYVARAGEVLAPHVRPGRLYVLESTSYPGTTEEVLQPLLERSGLAAGRDFHLAFSPEREDPGNKKYNTRNIPKVVSGLTPGCLEAARALYASVVSRVVPVSSTRTAELTKLIENIFRCVNIAMVNEIKVMCDKMGGMDVWEAIAAADTKPFGYMAFQPGPGLGGHCIPVDPFYFSWKARQHGAVSRLIETAAEINQGMPAYVVERTAEALRAGGKDLAGARVLLLGIAYKRDVDDVRESPALRLLELLSKREARVEYHDPHVPRLSAEWSPLAPMSSVELTPAALAGYDAVVIVSGHTAIDYRAVVENARLVIDTRNVTKGLKGLGAKVYGA